MLKFPYELQQPICLISNSGPSKTGENTLTDNSFSLLFPDENECSTNAGFGPCGQICVNTFLGYSCLCRPGYTLNNDKKTCTGKPGFLLSLYRK